MFKSCGGHGFHITFDNGWTVSVQFAPGNYCNNHKPFYRDPETANECANAEIAAWDSNGDWHKFEYDTVLGYQSPNQVLDFMNMISKLPASVKKAPVNERP